MEHEERLVFAARHGHLTAQQGDDWLVWWESDRASAEAAFAALHGGAQDRVSFAMAGARLRRDGVAGRRRGHG